MTDDRLYKLANGFIDSHRIEEYAAFTLRQLGLNARALDSVADGDVSNKKADIIISIGEHEQVAIEVKEARGAGISLGMPLLHNDEFATEGFTRYPRSLWCDSVKGWEEKKRWHAVRGVPLLGVMVACPIAELTDEEETTLGFVWLPDDGSWKKQTCYNKIRDVSYAAYKGCNMMPVRALANQCAAGA
jgi:hypothetical protein